MVACVGIDGTMVTIKDLEEGDQVQVEVETGGYAAIEVTDVGKDAVRGDQLYGTKELTVTKAQLHRKLGAP